MSKTRRARTFMFTLNITEAPLLLGETREQYHAFVAPWWRVLRPKGMKQQFHAMRISNLAWRLRRVPAFEAAVLRDCVENFLDYRRQEHRLLVKSEADLRDPDTITEEDRAGVAFYTLENLLTLSLPRYETHLQRQLRDELTDLATDQKDNGAADADDTWPEDEPPAAAPATEMPAVAPAPEMVAGDTTPPTADAPAAAPDLSNPAAPEGPRAGGEG